MLKTERIKEIKEIAEKEVLTYEVECLLDAIMNCYDHHKGVYDCADRGCEKCLNALYVILKLLQEERKTN